MIRNKAAAVGASLLISGAAAIGVSQPAQAAEEPSLQVCNSVNSVANIQVYNTAHTFSWELAIGACKTFGGQSTIRVDVDPDGGGQTDVDSYRIGVEGQGYGPCHSGENSASDPPNVSPKYVKYNTDASGC